MPSVLRVAGFVFVIFYNDHRPAHVHAFRGDAVVVIRIDGEQPELRSVRNMKQNDVTRAIQIAAENMDGLREAWRRIHGD